jgi:hypothetical protein
MGRNDGEGQQSCAHRHNCQAGKDPSGTRDQGGSAAHDASSAREASPPPRPNSQECDLIVNPDG